MKAKKDKNDVGMYESVFPMIEKDIEFEKYGMKTGVLNV